MGWLLMIRRVSAFTLVVTLVSLGVPVPANASGEQEQPSAQNSVLTLNGQPIRQFVSPTGHSRDAVLFSGLTPAQPSNGQISGVALDREGQPLAGQTVQLSRPSRGRLNATTDAGGQFSFTGLGPGRYEVTVRVDGQVISTNGRVELSEGAMVVSGVTVAPPAAEPAAERSWARRHAGLLGLGIGVGVVVAISFIYCATAGNCGLDPGPGGR